MVVQLLPLTFVPPVINFRTMRLPTFALCLSVMLLASCSDMGVEPRIERHGWLDVPVKYFHYTPQTIYIVIEIGESYTYPDSLLVINHFDDTTYTATGRSLFFHDGLLSTTFTFPEGYLSTFYPPNTYIYRYAGISLTFSARVHLP